MIGWSTLKKLIWLKKQGGAAIVWNIVTGVSPLSLPNAIAHAIRSLIQFGKCTQASTPTPDAPVDIVCNNGVLKWDSVNRRVYADGTPEVLTVSASGADSQTASMVNLLSVGDIADEQEIIGGGVTHKVGIKVFDGSEEWINGSNGYITEVVQDQSSGTYSPMCTHFRGTNTAPVKNSDSVRCYRTSGGVGRIYFAPNMTTYPTKEDFAAGLAAQYAAGTPVIVLYQLATPTTDSVTAQPLHTSAGDNTVSWTAEVSGTVKKVEYAQAATSGDNLVGSAVVGTAQAG